MIVSLARYLEQDAEEALRLANGKFYRRFTSMEAIAESEAQLADLSLESSKRCGKRLRTASAPSPTSPSACPSSGLDGSRTGSSRCRAG